MVYDGRGGGIRTPDPLLPKQMRYQAALRPDGRKACALIRAALLFDCTVRILYRKNPLARARFSFARWLRDISDNPAMLQSKKR